jgi:hypothetical protein
MSCVSTGTRTLYSRRARNPRGVSQGMNGPHLCCLDVGMTLCYHAGMKQRTGFRLSHDAMFLLEALAQANGISKTAVLELAIRDLAKKQGIHAPPRVQAESKQEPTSQD